MENLTPEQKQMAEVAQVSNWFFISYILLVTWLLPHTVSSCQFREKYKSMNYLHDASTVFDGDLKINYKALLFFDAVIGKISVLGRPFV